MKEEKKESPIGVLWGWGKPYHGKFIGSIILAVLGVACQMVPYFCVAHIVTMMLSGRAEFFPLCDRLALLHCAATLGKCCFRQSFYNRFPTQRPITRCAICGRISPQSWPASRWGRF